MSMYYLRRNSYINLNNVTIVEQCGNKVIITTNSNKKITKEFATEGIAIAEFKLIIRIIDENL